MLLRPRNTAADDTEHNLSKTFEREVDLNL